MEAASDPGQVILDEVAALEVERARVEARIAERMLAFDDLRRTESERPCRATPPAPPRRRRR